jgi:alpha-beta hydrolase superfamily lysophospholipase
MNWLRPRAVPWVVVVALLAGACAPMVRSAGPAVGVPHFDGSDLVTADGLALPMRRWLPEDEADPPAAVVVALHGFNDYSAAFDAPGRFLAARGIAVYAFDQRGFGEAPERGRWAGSATMAADLDDMLRLVAARHPGVPLYVLGESMGGAVALVALALPDHPPIQGVILAAPAVWARDDMSLLQRSALWLAAHTVPWLTLTGEGLHITASDNLEMLRRMSRDPLVIKETRVEAIHGLCDLMDDAMTAAPALALPTLVLVGDHDEVVPAEPVWRMVKTLPGTPVVARYANGYHMVLRDLDADLVLTDVATWIADPARSLPSAADRRAAADPGAAP